MYPPVILNKEKTKDSRRHTETETVCLCVFKIRDENICVENMPRFSLTLMLTTKTITSPHQSHTAHVRSCGLMPQALCDPFPSQSHVPLSTAAPNDEETQGFVCLKHWCGHVKGRGKVYAME